jgi:hypothetical protein
MGDISLRGRGVVKVGNLAKRKKLKKGGLSRRGFLGVMAGAAAAPDIFKALQKSEKKAVKAARVSSRRIKEVDNSYARRKELIDKVNNKTATQEEKDLLEGWQIMDMDQ